MKTLIAPLAALLLAMTAHPAVAQHTGHEGHAMPAPKPAAKKPVSKPTAKKPAAKKPAAKTPAAKKPAPVDHAAMGHGAHAAPKPAAKPASRAARPAARAPTKQPGANADHAAMGHGAHAAPKPRSAAKPAAKPAPVDHAAMGHGSTPPESARTPAAATDHAQMDRSRMDHAGMDHGTTPATSADPSQVDHAAMGHAPQAASADHGGMSPAGHAAMGHGTDRDLPADAAPRTPIPALTDADRAAAFPRGLHGHTAHDRRTHSYWLADRLEWQDADDATLGWEGLAWIGGDIHRLWLRSEGEASGGDVEHGDIEVLYGRSVAPWWDVVTGVRHDVGEGPSRTWAAVGVQGLAPYKFEVEATAYVGGGGRTAATLEAEYDTLITNRLILQWQAEAELHGKDDPAVGIGSGLSSVEAGARLRYEVTRRFAPYVGVQVERAFGGTADLRREHGEPVRDTRLVAGIRFWF